MILMLFNSTQTLAQLAVDPARQDAYRRGSSLILMVSLLGIIVIMVLALIIVLRRNRRRRDQAHPNRPSLKHVDAWAEAGRRFDNSITQLDPDEDEDTVR